MKAQAALQRFEGSGFLHLGTTIALQRACERRAICANCGQKWRARQDSNLRPRRGRQGQQIIENRVDLGGAVRYVVAAFAVRSLNRVETRGFSVQSLTTVLLQWAWLAPCGSARRHGRHAQPECACSPRKGPDTGWTGRTSMGGIAPMSTRRHSPFQDRRLPA